MGGRKTAPNVVLSNCHMMHEIQQLTPAREIISQVGDNISREGDNISREGDNISLRAIVVGHIGHYGQSIQIMFEAPLLRPVAATR